MGKLIKKVYKTETKASSDSSRSLVVKISTSSPDRSRDVVNPAGVELKNYLANPVVALNHDYHSLPIGKTTEIEVKEDSIVAKVQFPDAGVYPLADTVLELYKGGFMNAWSIGFIPLESVELDGGGYRFEKAELLEYSAVLVPDNPEALTVMRSKGIDPDHLEKYMIKNDDEPEEDKEDEVEEEEQESVEETPETPEEDKKDEETANPTGSEEVSAPALDTSEESAEVTETPEDKSVKKSTKLIKGKTRKSMLAVIENMTALTASLNELLEETVDEEVSSEKENQTVISLVEGLRMADKTIGLALRNYKDKISG